MSSAAGPLSIREAQKRLAIADRKAKWPYSWRQPPPGSLHFSPFGTTPVAANQTNVVVVSYTVPEGFTGVLTGVILDLAQLNGSPVAWNPPFDVSWTLALNFSVITGSPGLPAFRVFQDFNNVPFTVASFNLSGEPWPIWSGETDLLPSKTVVSILASSSNTIPLTNNPVWRGGLTGYRFPNMNET